VARPHAAFDPARRACFAGPNRSTGGPPMLDLAPDDVIATETELRARFARPSRLATLKQLDRLDHNCRRFIELSPLVCLATARPGGLADNSPRGDAPGFVKVLDERTLLIPDRPGNNR